VDLADNGSTVTLISGLLILGGVLGVVVPVLPGLWLCWAGVLLWALLGDADGAARWVVVTIATIVVVAGTTIKYLWPGRRLARTGVPTSALLLGGVLGLLGFFVIPVVGLPLGFVGGVWISERSRRGSWRAAWPSTRAALGAAGLAMLIEFAAAVGVAATWLAAVLLT
jgi:hypothetical protein